MGISFQEHAVQIFATCNAFSVWRYKRPNNAQSKGQRATARAMRGRCSEGGTPTPLIFFLRISFN